MAPTEPMLVPFNAQLFGGLFENIRAPAFITTHYIHPTDPPSPKTADVQAQPIRHSGIRQPIFGRIRQPLTAIYSYL